MATHKEIRERKREMIRLCEGGESVNDIAELFNLDTSYVSRVVRKVNTKRNGIRKETQEKRANIVRLIREGKSVQEVAEEVGAGEDYVIRTCRQSAIRFGSKLPASNYKIIAALIRGEKQADIARAVGITRQFVSVVKRRCEEEGIL